MFHDSTFGLAHSPSSQPSYDAPGAPAGFQPTDTARYTADLLVELRDLAGAAGHTFLAYLIQVAIEEARYQAR